jgi:copper chaperone NosL
MWIAAALASSACRHPPPAPVEIEPYDVCSLCKMAMSERRFASELIDSEGAAHKFDDLHCLLSFRRQRQPRIAAAYVTDYETRNWVEASRAHFVRSSGFATPMGGGMVAFADRAAAERHAHAHGAAVLRFTELPEE